MISDINLQVMTSQVINPATGAQELSASSVAVGGVAITAMTANSSGTAIVAGGDLGNDIGEGEPLYLIFTNVGGATFTGVTSVVFEFVTSVNADLSSPRVIIRTAEIPVGTCVAGFEVPIRIQLDPADKNSQLDRYIGAGISAVGGAGPLANATIDAHFVHGNQKGGMKFYPSAIIVEPQ